MNNTAELLSVLGLIGSIISFIIGFFKWIKTREQEEQTRRYEQFHRAFEWLAGRTASGHLLVDTQQAMAAYEMARFPEYVDISLPIIEYYLSNESNESLFRAALLHAKSELTR